MLGVARISISANPLNDWESYYYTVMKRFTTVLLAVLIVISSVIAGFTGSTAAQTADTEVIYVGDGSQVIAYNQDGTKKWSTQVDGRLRDLQVGAEGSIYAGHEGGVTKIGTDGGIIWRTNSGDTAYQIDVKNGEVLHGAAFSTYAKVIDADTGGRIHTLNTDDDTWGVNIASDTGNYQVGGGDANMYVFDSTGQRISKNTVGGYTIRSIEEAANSDDVIIGTRNEGVKYAVGGDFSNIKTISNTMASVEDIHYISSEDMYVINGEDGDFISAAITMDSDYNTIQKFTHPTDRPDKYTGAAYLPSGNIGFSASNTASGTANGVEVFDTAGSFKNYFGDAGDTDAITTAKTDLGGSDIPTKSEDAELDLRLENPQKVNSTFDYGVTFKNENGTYSDVTSETTITSSNVTFATVDNTNNTITTSGTQTSVTINATYTHSDGFDYTTSETLQIRNPTLKNVEYFDQVERTTIVLGDHAVIAMLILLGLSALLGKITGSKFASVVTFMFGSMLLWALGYATVGIVLITLPGGTVILNAMMKARGVATT